MKFHLVSSFLLRAPLLPIRALRRPGAALQAHPLGPAALALASPDLADGLRRGGSDAERAVDRYGRRAAFRPTPHGLLAGVMMGKLGARTAIDTTGSHAYRTVGWARLAAIGRALLDDPETRAQARLRAAPSLLVTGTEAVWLALPAEPDGTLEPRQAELDPPLAAVLAATGEWSSWAAVRAAAARGFSEEGGTELAQDADELDEYLLVLATQGLLHFDLCPPLVGRPPLLWMRERLAALGTDAAEAAARALDEPPPATLVHEGTAVLSRAVVERAAALAPLLFRLQEALSPPAAERFLGRALLERLASMAELFGAGAFGLAGLATGAFGSNLAFVDEEPVAASPPESPILGLLVEALTEAARAGRDVIDLDPATLDTLLPAADAPPSFELILTPSSHPPGRGRQSSRIADWLLGLHAPAGSSWGRFAHALGAPMTGALSELAAAERAAYPGEPTADVAFASSAALADLCAHPPARASTLALVGWPEGPAIPVAALGLVVDPSAPLRLVHEGRDLRPSPLHRVRSTTAPPGLYSLLAGWSFVRQHAPWAFGWGALAGLPRLPRVRLDGFVVAPASWRIPPAEDLKGQGLRRWREAAAVPRQVQVGEGDELLLVDLGAPEAAQDLARHAGARAYEIWPPLESLADQGGRRVEAVVAVVQSPPSSGIESGSVIPAESSAGSISAFPAAGWSTYKLFGAEDRQDDLLVLVVAPLIAEAQRAGLVDRWHFLRYVDAGTRDHLRLRLRAPSERARQAIDRRLRAQLVPPREAGALAAVETAEYFPEHARYGGAQTFEAVERLFELDSALVLQLLSVSAETDDPLASDRLEWLVRGFDALTRGLGLDLAARHALAARRRAAHLVDPSPETARALDGAFRARQRRLAGLLGGAGPTPDPCAPALEAYAARVEAVASALEPAVRASVISVMPPVLHLNAVRLLGPRPDEEASAYFFWERTLEGLAARRRRSDPGHKKG